MQAAVMLDSELRRKQESGGGGKETESLLRSVSWCWIHVRCLGTSKVLQELEARNCAVAAFFFFSHDRFGHLQLE